MVPRGLGFWGLYAPTHLACAGVGMRVLGAASAQGSWFCVLLEMFVAQGEHPLHRESVSKVPRCHCSQMAAGSLGPLPWKDDADPAGPHALLLPPHILRTAWRHRSRDRTRQLRLCMERGLGAATSPPAPVHLLRGVPSGDTLLPRSKPRSWDFRGREQQVLVILRHGTKKELGDRSAHPPAVTSSPVQHWGWPWQRWDKPAKPWHAS